MEFLGLYCDSDMNEWKDDALKCFVKLYARQLEIVQQDKLKYPFIMITYVLR
jgi:hypothetical protein